MPFTYKSLVLVLVHQYLFGRLVLAHSCVFVCFFGGVGVGREGGVSCAFIYHSVTLHLKVP